MQESPTTTTWQSTPAGQQVLEKFSEEKTLHAIERILSRMDTLEKAVDNLSTMMRQGPGLVAMAADMADEGIREANANGVNIEERLKNGAFIAEKLTAPDMVEKLDKLIVLSDQLPGLVAMVMDTVDENMKYAIENGFDPRMLREVASTANDALTNARAEPPAKVGGVFGILRTLKDPDRQKGLGFLMNFLKHFGRNI